MTFSEWLSKIDPDALKIVGVFSGLVGTLLGTFLGFLISRFTMTKSERLAVEQRMTDNADKHTIRKAERYSEFTKALTSYASKTEPLTLDDFYAVSTAGDNYFNELRAIADAILDNKIPKGARDNTFVPDIRRAVEKNIDLYYKTLTEIAEKVGAVYTGRFDRRLYKSLYSVLEKYPERLDVP